MQILSIRCGATRNLGNYESAKLEVEASPSDGQSSAELLTELNDYLEKSIMSDGIKPPAAKKSDTKPPLDSKKVADAVKKAAKKAAAAAKKSTKMSNADLAGGQTSDDKPPFDADAKTTPAEKATLAKPSKDMARDVFAVLTSAKTLEELLKNFNEFRDPGLGYRALLTKKEWQKSINKVQDCYKSLTTADSDADVMHDLVAAINSERNTAK